MGGPRGYDTKLSLIASARCRYCDSSLTPDNQPQPVLLPQDEHV